MKTCTLEDLAGQVGLSARQVQRYLRALNIRPTRILDGRNHYPAEAAALVTTAALSARAHRADAIRLSIARARNITPNQGTP